MPAAPDFNFPNQQTRLPGRSGGAFWLLAPALLEAALTWRPLLFLSLHTTALSLRAQAGPGCSFAAKC